MPENTGLVSPSVPDFSREFKPWFAWDPGRCLLASLRSYQRHRSSSNPLPIGIKVIAVLRHRFWSVITGADIPLNCQIGGVLLISHRNGIVIHLDAKKNLVQIAAVSTGYDRSKP